SRVHVVPPGPPDARRLLEDDEVGGGPLPQLDRRREAAEPGPDDGYAQRAPRAASPHATLRLARAVRGLGDAPGGSYSVRLRIVGTKNAAVTPYASRARARYSAPLIFGVVISPVPPGRAGTAAARCPRRCRGRPPPPAGRPGVPPGRPRRCWSSS